MRQEPACTSSADPLLQVEHALIMRYSRSGNQANQIFASEIFLKQSYSDPTRALDFNTSKIKSVLI